MKKILLVLGVVTLAIAGVTLYFSKPSIKLLEELPVEQIKPFGDLAGYEQDLKGTSDGTAGFVVEDGTIFMCPNTGNTNTGFEIHGDFDFSDYKCARFTVENLDPAPLSVWTPGEGFGFVFGCVGLPLAACDRNGVMVGGKSSSEETTPQHPTSSNHRQARGRGMP